MRKVPGISDIDMTTPYILSLAEQSFVAIQHLKAIYVKSLSHWILLTV
jgi:hypothetical protein